MTSASAPQRAPHWPGLCRDFHSTVVELGATKDGIDLRRRAEARFLYAEHKPFLLGPPQLIRGALADTLRRVTGAYHRCIERIVLASRNDERVRNTLSTPPALARDLADESEPANSKIHIMRLDILLDRDGGFQILETNANCPGGFVFSGICNRAWREFLEAQGCPVPPALKHERKGFMAEWFLEVIEEDTGAKPDFLAFLREEGGNRFELTDFGKHVRGLGIECEEIDPRELKFGGKGAPTANGRPITHAYQKLGMQRFLELRPDLDPFVAAVRDRSLFVQNGQKGRWVGDDKLCLAMISDPDFAGLFAKDDLKTLEPHVPWSRNAGHLPADRLESVRRERGAYVLKRGLDTRGHGVVVGRETDDVTWAAAVDFAVRDAWLVQEFHETTWIERDFDSPHTQRHDVALGAINGELTTLFMRSSGEMRVNMARTGRMHPVFLGTGP